MKNDRPNILFLMPDQQRPDSLGCYGDPVAMTPNLDALANNGVVFDNCYVQNPLCCPSRYSMLTGRYPHCHGVRSNWFAPKEGEVSFGHQLGKVGYRSALIGKMHFTPWHDNFGFDGRVIAEAKFQVNCPDDYERFLNKHGTSRTELYETRSEEYLRNASAVPSKLPQELHIDSFIGTSICEYLERVDGPFCLFGSFVSPHNPYDPPEPYVDLFTNADLPARNMGEGEVDRKPREAYDYINRTLGWPDKTDEFNAEQLHLMRAYYYSLNTLIDDWIGCIVDTLKKRGLYDNTIIVYTSDHGDLLGDHGLVYKQCFYEQSVKVPLIVHAPARFPARRVSDLVESIDVFNTFCDVARADPGPGAQGKSLVPLLEGQDGHVHREAVFSENYFGRMVREGDHKLVYYPGKPYGELYNLADDPDEQDNLWDSAACDDVKQRLQNRLLEWAFTSEDPTPLPARPGHFDDAPRQTYYCHGRTEECARQPWHLQDMQDLYETWEFARPGTTR
jgi:arylsulfatase